MRYRIEWCKEDGSESGFGEWSESRAFLQQWINRKNEKHRGKIRHWITEEDLYSSEVATSDATNN